MPMPRRRFLLAAAASPLLASCAADLARYQDEPVAGLASRLGLCAAAYTLLAAGRPQPAVALGSCVDAGTARPDSIFQAASLTKPVVAFAALRLARAGRLDLKAPVATYLPQGYAHYPSRLRRGPGDAHDLVPAATLARVPVATLLNHTSGLPNWAAGPLAPEFATAFEPGTRWRYSGEGYVLLQAVIEAVAGLPFADFMARQVFEPLGMHDTSLAWHERLAGRAVAGRAAGGALREARFRHAVAAASLYTTAGDYARFMAAFAADEAMVTLALSNPVPVSPELGLEWGHGWGLERTAGGTNLWQWGNNPGFRSFAMFSAATRDGFVVLTNSERGMPLAVPLARQSLPGEHSVFRFGRVAG